MKLIDVFALFVVHIAVFPSYNALSVTFKQVFAYGITSCYKQQRYTRENKDFLREMF